MYLPIHPGIVGRFLGDVNIVGMALGQACAGDADEFGVAAHILDGGRSAVAHGGTKAAHQLEYGVGKRSLVRHAAFNAFGYQLLGVFLEIAVLAAVGHGGQGAHAAVGLEGTALIDFHFAGGLLGSGEQAAQHDGLCACADGLGDVTGILDAAVGDDGDVILVRFLGASLAELRTQRQAGAEL